MSGATLLEQRGVGASGKALRKDHYFHQTGYDPHEAQKKVHYDTHRHRVLANGRRWGKTLLGGKEVEVTNLVLNRYGSPQRGWIVGPNYADAEKEFRVVYDSLRAQGYDRMDLVPKFVNNADSGNMHIRTRWGWDIQCRSAQYPESLVGEGLDFVVMVEAGRQKARTWSKYIRPALSDKRGWSLHTGVPEGDTSQSLLYALWQRGQSGKLNHRSWASWRMPSWTNRIIFPGGRQDEEILEAEEDLTEDEFASQYGAEFVDKVGRVMKEWDDEVHLRDLTFNPKWPLYAGVDYGFTNPFVWLWIQVDPFDNVYVLEEFYQRGRDTEEICRDYLERHPWTSSLIRFYPDPADPDDTRIIERMIRKPSSAEPTGGELKTRLALIRQALKRRPTHLDDDHPEKLPRLMIDRSCEHLAWEMREGYRWPQTRNEQRNDRENPLPKDDHGPEALGRFFRGYYGLPGQDQKKGTRQRRARVRR